ncbi:hypothetical protein J6590_006488 [Homalodisca vitripennis]|nr:hypothetical protein J6590_006488 [Homalodisca vitripennis]
MAPCCENLFMTFKRKTAVFSYVTQAFLSRETYQCGDRISVWASDISVGIGYRFERQISVWGSDISLSVNNN